MTSPPLRPELIEDHEVRSSTQDELGHRAIADKLAELVAEVPTPTNIALYGPWGSGKTGIANLLASRFESDGKKYRGYKFARFDAFKFADVPLRRNLISAIASELGLKDAKYHEDLYSDVVTTKFTLPTKKIRSAIPTLILIFFALAAVFAGLAALVALQQPGPWPTNFAKNAKPYLSAGFPAAAIVAGIFALITRALGSEHRTDRADSDEQFEEIFRSLVEDSGAKKLVVFVDEIDRCAPTEVVETLDVVRTFLGLNKCVFIVAADQQVLETALNLKVRQATPDDVINPYYSSGSAYLDKVFQHQMSVPPLRNQSVTHYALELIENRAGVWRAPERETIVSVLVPSHVRSPRRVKHLLNSYVVAHRVAAERANLGLLDSWDSTRSIELAKLVCLQVEFPIFARAIADVQRLPEYVLAASKTDDWVDQFPYIKPREQSLADEFASGRRAADVVLADPADHDDPVSEESETERQTVGQAHGTQLIDYLSRTELVPGPRSDLIFMQGVGTPFGLSSEVADRILQASQNARLDAVRSEITNENADAILDLVMQEVRSARGIEHRNVASVALGLLEHTTVDQSDRADSLLTILAPALSEAPELVSASSIRGLWHLTGLSTLAESQRLAHAILSSDELTSDVSLAGGILVDYDRALGASTTAVDKLVTDAVASINLNDFVAALGDSSETISHLLDAAPSLPTAVSTLFKQGNDARDRLDADKRAATAYANRRATYTSVAEPTPTAEEDDEYIAERAVTFGADLQTWGDQLAELGDMNALQALIRVLLKADRWEARTIIQGLLPVAGSWASESDNDLILTNLDRRPLSDTGPWLDALDPHAASSSLLTEKLNNIGQKLWNQEEDASVVSDIGARAGRVMGLSSSEQQASFERVVLDEIDSAVADDEQADARVTQLNRATLIVASGAISQAAVCRVEAYNLSEALKVEHDEQEADSSLMSYVDASLRRIWESWGAPDPIALPEELYMAIQECDWLPEPTSTIYKLNAQSRVGRSDEVPSVDDIVNLIAEHSTDAARLGSAWLQAHRTADADDLHKLLMQVQRHNAWQDERFCTALETARQALPTSDQIALLRRTVDGRFGLPARLVDSLGFREIPDEDAIEMLIDRISTASRNSDRRDVLSLATARTYSSRTARHRFITDLVVPQFVLGFESTMNALEAIRRFGKPFPGDTRSVVLAGLKPVAEANDRLRKRATEVLVPLGFPAKGRGPLGLGRREIKL